MEESVEHRITVTQVKENGDLYESCSCGLSWSHPKNRTYEQREAVYEAHVKYKRPLTKPD